MPDLADELRQAASAGDGTVPLDWRPEYYRHKTCGQESVQLSVAPYSMYVCWACSGTAIPREEVEKIGEA